MSKSVFRTSFIERMSTPEQLDQLVTVTTPLGWLALITLCLLLGAAMLWGFLGRIPETVAGTGYILLAGGVNAVVSPAAGQVVEVHVEVDDQVEEGQVIARVTEEGKLAATRIVSPYAGRVLDIKVEEGDLVSLGAPILSLERDSQDTEGLIAVVYVPSGEGNKIERGDTVHVVPATVHKEESGYILGKVESRSEFPVDDQSMLRTLDNEAFVQNILSGFETRPLQVLINLVPDRDGPRWFPSRESPPQVASGTPCMVDIIISQKRPIDVLFQR